MLYMLISFSASYHHFVALRNNKTVYCDFIGKWMQKEVKIRY